MAIFRLTLFLITFDGDAARVSVYRYVFLINALLVSFGFGFLSFFFFFLFFSFFFFLSFFGGKV